MRVGAWIRAKKAQAVFTAGLYGTIFLLAAAAACASDSDGTMRWVDPTAFDGSLAAAEAYAYANGKGIKVWTSTDLHSSLTVRCPLHIEQGGTITQTGSFTLVINGPFRADGQVFRGFHPGQVTGLREARPEWWGDGSTASQCAIDSGASVTWSKKAYDLGSLPHSGVAVTIKGKHGVTYTSLGASFTVATRSAGGPSDVFLVSDSTDLVFAGSWSFQDLGYDETKTWKGARAFTLSASTGPVSNVHFDKIYVYNMVAALLTAGVSSYRVSGITVENIYAKNSYYGVNCSENGDNLTILNLVTDNVHRGYFVYGVSSHNVNYTSLNHTGSGGYRDVYIQANGRDTDNIKLRMVVRKCSNGASEVAIQNSSKPGRAYAIRNIDIYYDDVDSSNSNGSSIALDSRTPGGALESIATNTFQNITLRGRSRHPLSINSAVTNQCVLRADAEIFDPSFSAQSDTKGFVVDFGDYIVQSVNGNLNNTTLDFAVQSGRRFDKRFTMIAVDKVDDWNPATYRLRSVEGIVHGTYSKDASSVIVNSTSEVSNTYVNTPGTYTVIPNGGNLRFMFSGWSGAGNGRVTIKMDK